MALVVVSLACYPPPYSGVAGAIVEGLLHQKGTDSLRRTKLFINPITVLVHCPLCIKSDVFASICSSLSAKGSSIVNFD